MDWGSSTNLPFSQHIFLWSYITNYLTLVAEPEGLKTFNTKAR
jgi:hypothetical protein